MPPAAVPTEIPRRVPLDIVSPSAEPPDGDGWLHEVKHDGHRLLAIVAGDDLKLISRNGHDRTQLFREPFEKLLVAGPPTLVLDGEIAVPDEKGVTHLDQLSEALRLRQADQLAYFAFDLLHLDGHDLCPCPIEDRKALLRDVVGAAGCPRLVAVDHIALSAAACSSSRRCARSAPKGLSRNVLAAPRAGTNRDWLKTKVSGTGMPDAGHSKAQSRGAESLRGACRTCAGRPCA